MFAVLHRLYNYCWLHKMRTITLIFLFLVLTGCSSQRQANVFTPDDYLAALETLELDQSKYESYQKYYDSVNDRMETWLKQIEDPEQLRVLFWKCNSVCQSEPESPQYKLQWIGPHFESKNLIMYRLAEQILVKYL